MGVRVAFENHVHIMKKSYPMDLEGNPIVNEDSAKESGANEIVFVGDGAWGVDVGYCTPEYNGKGLI